MCARNSAVLMTVLQQSANKAQLGRLFVRSATIVITTVFCPSNCATVANDSNMATTTCYGDVQTSILRQKADFTWNSQAQNVIMKDRQGNLGHVGPARVPKLVSGFLKSRPVFHN